ncbi:MULTISPECIES: hypothetical protein [Paenibacillus]|uniref:Uncharacterized protein n=1 Tax=Paenibacillus pabuli TaxID=1472 RepID=A0A855XW95_9BACL|nr:MULTISPECIES: hypothetical protein [Paenibacillus]PWW37362.1 hypothetical protein DET56_109248 [Paenibacillus pabuli]PXW05504.1 hypothetical protein DEU73_108247 [Paenibacillus taichungensis]
MIRTIKTIGRFVIQDRKTGQYLQHNGIECDNPDHPYNDVDSTDEATVWGTLEHVAYVLWWFVDMNGDYRIINLGTKQQYVKDKKRGIAHVVREEEQS